MRGQCAGAERYVTGSSRSPGPHSSSRGLPHKGEEEMQPEHNTAAPSRKDTKFPPGGPDRNTKRRPQTGRSYTLQRGFPGSNARRLRIFRVWNPPPGDRLSALPAAFSRTAGRQAAASNNSPLLCIQHSRLPRAPLTHAGAVPSPFPLSSLVTRRGRGQITC